MLIMIDNYDSFTYNLVQYLKQMDMEVLVVRNDKITIDEIQKLKPYGIVISPGPGKPEDAGISISIIKNFSGKIPILGICLGHQAIVSAFGGKVIKSPKIMHGKTSMIAHDEKTIFKGIQQPFEAMRYHSLIAEKKSLPDCLLISAETSDGEIMGVRHKELFIEGLQFHPESIKTSSGKRILRNFVNLIGGKNV